MNKQKNVIALGFFDGVHRGHQALLKCAVERGRELGMTPAVFTFDRSPKEFVSGVPVPLITAPEERRETVHAVTLRRDQILVLVSDGFSPEEVLRCCTEQVGQPADRLGNHLMSCLKNGRGDDATAVLVTLENYKAFLSTEQKQAVETK